MVNKTYNVYFTQFSEDRDHLSALNLKKTPQLRGMVH